ncbi:hypothetical protein EVG20_g10465, partial [Dentipellis fragilis]
QARCALRRVCSRARARAACAAPPETDSEPQAGKSSDAAEGARKKHVDDGEMGGEVLGTMIWEEYERELKAWEAAEKEREELAKGEGERSGRHTPPTVDIDTPSLVQTLVFLVPPEEPVQLEVPGLDRMHLYILRTAGFPRGFQERVGHRPRHVIASLVVARGVLDYGQ